MEEASSLDSFHTDGGDSVQESEVAKSCEDVSQISTDKPDNDKSPKNNEKDGNEEDNDEEFEQVSDGTFELDDSSQATSTGPQPNDGISEKSAEVEGENKSRTVDDNPDDDGRKSTDFEEVETHLSSNTNATPEESNMLGESDMTLPENESETVGVGEKSSTEVDAHNDSGDVEMASANDSMDVDEDRAKASETPEQLGELTATAEDSQGEDADVDKGEESKKDDPEGDASRAEDDDAEKEGDTAERQNDDEVPSEVLDDEAEDEPVENVQEPEESDVCLIPDDTETQVTDAEKEQAILARENAEKEDAEAQAVKEKEADAVEKDAAEKADDETGAETDAQADKARVESCPEDSPGKDNQAAADPNDVADAADAADQEVEEVQVAAGGSEVVSKIIIGWIVSMEKKCIQCGEEKSCGFRFKNPETSEFDYVCEPTCCEAIIAANPGKYFIRRKKYLVEELTPTTHKKDSDSNKPETEQDEDQESEEHAKSTPKESSCIQCKEKKPCKYFLKQDDELFYICSDDCYNLLSAEEPDKFKLKRHSIRVRNIGATISSLPAKSTPGPEPRVVARTTAEAEAARLERVASFIRRCAECFSEITLGDKNLVWETMDFCNEICLGKHQRNIGSSCQTCHGEVSHHALGKYCVRFGFDIRQFCCASCLNEFKKGLKTCSCCQKDISSGSEGFLAPVGDKEQFKDFCSQACMRRYDSMVNPKKKLRHDVCAVCNNDKPVRVEIILDEKEHMFCSNPCFSAFKFVSNIVADQCAMCSKYFERKSAESFTIYSERRAKVFCTRICLNVYITNNRKIVSCQWCKVKKYNFDMIYKQHDSQEILMCSLNCLTLYGVSINAFSRTVVKCDNCSETATPQYHLTMSDASMRNFCTYQCVMQFQSQFARAPLTLENETQQQQKTQQSSVDGGKGGAPFPTGLPKRVKLKMTAQQQQEQKQSGTPMSIKLSKGSGSNKKGPTMPVISTVSSLASGETETMIGSVTVRRSRGRGRKLDSPPPLLQLAASNPSNGRGRRSKTLDEASQPSLSPTGSAVGKRGSVSSSSAATEKVSVQTETKIVTVPPYPPLVRNVQTNCKPQTVTVGFQVQPATENVGTQTSKDYSNKVLIPVPVPIYVPQPMYMYSMPFPVPVPIPLPIPVPIFIPTTRNSAQGILKEIKKIQDKMPADPFEAELLMMAEMVAEEKNDSGSDSEDDIKPDPGDEGLQYDSGVHPVEVGNNYGEDVLQIALKMATGEYDQSTVDLESAMAANTITNPPVSHDGSINQIGHIQEQVGGRGRKRGAAGASPVSPRANRSPNKRPRLQEIEQSVQAVATPAVPVVVAAPTPVVEKPDANMCLKYTFGVNAWKQWVMTKNSDIEKSSIRRRPFKTELLQMTADELNHSLCLFVKEVRKPNGTEYAPDTIYYLVLGIQQYLYENGRIDNIFTDPYYERFTDCLDEVARKFSVLYNDSQYIVTRVEEEHLWECKQLGAHSPHVLLSTLMFFNTKHFNLTTVEEHMQLSFSHIMKHWKRSAQNAKLPGTRNVLLRFYPPQAGLDANPRKKKVYEQQENEDNPLRCPVRLYEFYLSKCPESVKTRNDVFYLQPERSCVPDSPVWYSTQPLSQDHLRKMLHRVKMVKEINIALLTS